MVDVVVLGTEVLQFRFFTVAIIICFNDVPVCQSILHGGLERIKEMSQIILLLLLVALQRKEAMAIRSSIMI